MLKKKFLSNSVRKQPISLKLLKTVLSLFIFFIASKQALGQSFIDMPPSNPAYLAVEQLKNIGIIQGYNDNTFRPDQKVNRAEALKIILKAGKIQVGTGLFNSGFSDVPLDSWFSGYVMIGKILNIIKGNPDGTFAPSRNVNKAEFLKILLETFQVTLDTKIPNNNIAIDVKPNDWFEVYFNYALTEGLIYKNFQGQLEPQKNLNRGECAEIIYNMYVLKNGGESQRLLSQAESKLIDALIQINASNLSAAILDSNQAVFYTQNALKAQPQEKIIQAANKIALAFQKLFSAYQAVLANQFDQMKTIVQEVKSLASESIVLDNSTADLAQKIETLADDLLKKNP